MLTCRVMLKDLPVLSLPSRAEERSAERPVLTILKPRFQVSVAPVSGALEVKVAAEAFRPNLRAPAPV